MNRKLGQKRKSARKVPKYHVEPDRWQPLTATPAYDGKVDTDYALSLAETAFTCPLYQVGMNAKVWANGAFIDLARNIAAWELLNNPDYEKCTHLFFIDGDLRWPANAFIGLVRAGYPVVAGVYRRREASENYPAVYTPEADTGGLIVDDQGFILHDRVPTGFLCIRRDIIEQMSADEFSAVTKHKGEDIELPWLFGTKFDENRRFVGEDFSWCDKYVKAYGPIPVWANIDFVHGGLPGNYESWLAKQIDAAAADTSEVA